MPIHGPRTCGKRSTSCIGGEREKEKSRRGLIGAFSDMSRRTRRRTYRGKSIVCPGPCNPRNRCCTIPNNNINKGDNAGGCPLGRAEMVPRCLSRKLQTAGIQSGCTQRPTDQLARTLRKPARGRVNRTPAMQSNAQVRGIFTLSSRVSNCCLAIVLLVLLHTLVACAALQYNWYEHYTAIQFCGVVSILLWQITGSAAV
ncbi:uncharacterized protein LOC135165823 [Diachasmimorpha longicaudata]|uniref:uncharacterized protein LOC135165823 n=1 Tax=Diachasmimorpha longicaudata TaxID=58733 RepID=UPI0030B87960